MVVPVDCVQHNESDPWNKTQAVSFYWICYLAEENLPLETSSRVGLTEKLCEAVVWPFLLCMSASNKENNQIFHKWKMDCRVAWHSLTPAEFFCCPSHMCLTETCERIHVCWIPMYYKKTSVAVHVRTDFYGISCPLISVAAWQLTSLTPNVCYWDLKYIFMFVFFL